MSRSPSQMRCAPPSPEEFRDRVAALFKNHREAAAAFGVTQVTMSAWCRGKSPISQSALILLPIYESPMRDACERAIQAEVARGTLRWLAQCGVYTATPSSTPTPASSEQRLEESAPASAPAPDHPFGTPTKPSATVGRRLIGRF